MTKRAALLLLCAAFLLLCALSTRGTLFWFLFWILLIMTCYGIISTIWTYQTLRVHCGLDHAHVTRGEAVQLFITLYHRCPLPVAPVRLDISAASDEGMYEVYCQTKPFQENTLSQLLYCPHVGAYPAGVSKVTVQDAFCLFSLGKAIGAANEVLVVQPQIYVMESLAFSPGESDTESVSRAFEDATMPTDVRVYQPGDELKKVHWKLSMRRRELLVRVYEQPMRPDALLLVDCAPPLPLPGGNAASVRDAICEAAASLASVALSKGAPVRMPLLGELPTDINAQKPEDMPMVRDALGRCAFDGAQQFERVLLLETRRLRRTGSTAIITSRMNPVIADMIMRIRRMGPKVRVLLAADAEDETTNMLVHRLMRNDVEVTTLSIETY